MNAVQRRIGAGLAAVAIAGTSLAAGTQLAETATAQQVAPAVTTPLRPSYQDVSLKVLQDLPAYDFYRGRTATQTQKDAMEESLVGVYIPELFRYASQSNRRCAGQVQAMASELSKVTAKLGPIYEDNSLAGSSWSIPASGRHYSIEKNILDDIRSCSLSGGGIDCGMSPLMHPGLADLLDIRVDEFTRRCIKGATFTPTLPVENYSSARAGLGTVQSRKPLPPLTAQQIALLVAAHDAHVATSDNRCGARAGVPTVSVQGAHLALEATAATEEQHHFLRMKDFSGAVDGLWDIQAVCKLARLQDSAHARWMQAVVDLDWRVARQADNDHQLMHIGMGMFTTGVFYRLSCPPAKTASCKQGNQNITTILANIG